MFNLMVMTPLQFKQECIPVGCVPPARYHTGVNVNLGGGGGHIRASKGTFRGSHFGGSLSNLKGS